MKAVILAGGKGSRLQGLVKDAPKPMAEVAGRPFLEYLILQLAKWKFRDVVLCVGYKKQAIMDYFKDGKSWAMNIGYSEEAEPLGTAGAIKNARGLIGEEEFLVMNGDSFLAADLNEITSFHKKHNALATICLAEVSDISRYGRVEISEGDEIISFAEKSSAGRGFINGGIYVFNPEILEHIRPDEASLEKEVLPRLTRLGLYGIKVKGFFVDIGIPRDFLSLTAEPQALLKAAII